MRYVLEIQPLAMDRHCFPSKHFFGTQKVRNFGLCALAEYGFRIYGSVDGTCFTRSTENMFSLQITMSPSLAQTLIVIQSNLLCTVLVLVHRLLRGGDGGSSRFDVMLLYE